MLYLSYIVTGASWSSAYDARVFTKDKTMKVHTACMGGVVGNASSPIIFHPYRLLHVQVQYYGLIKQSTGEDWEDAKISLSTAQPAIGGGAPSLPTKIIRFRRPVIRPGLAAKSSKNSTS